VYYAKEIQAQAGEEEEQGDSVATEVAPLQVSGGEEEHKKNTTETQKKLFSVFDSGK